jgi:hypothetical protein
MIAVMGKDYGASREFVLPTARAAFAAGEGILVGPIQGDEFDIQWMPPGEQEITCHVDDPESGLPKPREMGFTVKAEHAQKFNAMLQWLRAKAAAGEGDEPFIDFNHEDGAASGRPTEMYWGGEDVRKGGIRLKGRWTGSGKAAVVNKDYTRFSPQWDFHKKTDEPLAIGVNLGGLVNRAAFRSIAAVAKHGPSRSGQHATEANNNKERKNKMDRNEFKEMLDEGLKPILQDIAALKATAKAPETQTQQAATAQAAAGDEKIIKLITDANKPLMEKLTAMETAGTEAKKAQAKAAVQAHVKRGAIAPEDKDSLSIYESAYLADADQAERAMAKLPAKSFTRLTTSGAGATATATSGEPEHQFIAKAKDFAEKNKITDAVEAQMAYARTAEGQELYGQFRQKIVPKR